MGWKENPNLRKNIKSKLEKGLKLAGKIVEENIEDNAPVDTGKLFKSIEAKPVKDMTVEVVANVEYAQAIEFGTRYTYANPFMRRGLKKSKKEIVKEFKDII